MDLANGARGCRQEPAGGAGVDKARGEGDRCEDCQDQGDMATTLISVGLRFDRCSPTGDHRAPCASTTLATI